MSALIYLRPLKIGDAAISYKWRNDPKVWLYTNFVPSEQITPEIERKWLATVLKKKDQKRFAICIVGTEEYIGNIQLLQIGNNEAEFHLFIGEKKYWGRGIGFEATKQLLQIAFSDLKLEYVFLHVHPENIVAIRCYRRAGFEAVAFKNEMLKMVVKASSIIGAPSN